MALSATYTAGCARARLRRQFEMPRRRKTRPEEESSQRIGRSAYLDGVDVGLAGGVLLDEAGPSFLLGRECSHDLGPLLRQPLHAQAPDLRRHIQVQITAAATTTIRRLDRSRTSFSGAHSTSLHSESSGDEEALQDSVKNLLPPLIPPPPRGIVACWGLLLLRGTQLLAESMDWAGQAIFFSQFSQSRSLACSSLTHTRKRVSGRIWLWTREHHRIARYSWPRGLSWGIYFSFGFSSLPTCVWMTSRPRSPAGCYGIFSGAANISAG